MAECQVMTKRGKVCRAAALKGSDYCYMHSPERAGERAAARRLGGQHRGSHALEASSLPAKVRTVEDVLAVLDYTREELAALDNGIPRARALIALAGSYLQALEVGELEARLEALEAALPAKTGGRR